jgi:hypothetical protein
MAPWPKVAKSWYWGRWTTTLPLGECQEPRVASLVTEVVKILEFPRLCGFEVIVFSK